MASPYSALAIANEFIERGIATGRPVDPMKVQKLVYFSHGWHLGLFDGPLIDEQIEAWPYGPVVASVYHEFKRYGRSGIDEPAIDLERGRIRTPGIDPDDDRTAALLARVWQTYGKFNGMQLSTMSHEPGSPWDVTYNNRPPGVVRGIDIPNELLRQHFAELAKQKRA